MILVLHLDRHERSVRMPVAELGHLYARFAAVSQVRLHRFFSDDRYTARIELRILLHVLEREPLSCSGDLSDGTVLLGLRDGSLPFCLQTCLLTLHGLSLHL